jgi:hypothetical protein
MVKWPKGEPQILYFTVLVAYEVQCESTVHAEQVITSLNRFYREEPYRIETMDKVVETKHSIKPGGSGEIPATDTEVNP